jgi:hypothetical protein
VVSFVGKFKKWIINITILILVTIVMLLLAEIALRWLDGFRMSTLELRQDVNQTQSVE